MVTSDFDSTKAISPVWRGIAEELSSAAAAARTGDERALSGHVERALAMVKMRSISAESDVLPLWRRKRVFNYIETHLPARLRIAELAQHVGLSPSHLSRLFKNQVGLSPAAYVRRQRIARAREMLLTTSSSLAEIAVECGLTDQAHFTRVFRCLVGETPGRWRARELGLDWAGQDGPCAAYESQRTNGWTAATENTSA